MTLLLSLESLKEWIEGLEDIQAQLWIHKVEIERYVCTCHDHMVQDLEAVLVSLKQVAYA